MITNKDKDLLRHIEDYGFITISQAHFMLYPNMVRGYEYARQRIQRLKQVEKRLKCIHNTATKLDIYVDGDNKLNSISMHRIYTMNLYCHLIGKGAVKEKFELEKEWNEGKVRSDAFGIFIIGGYRFRLLVETNKSNNKLNLSKYDDIQSEILKECNNMLPRIVLIDDRKHNSYDTKIYQVVQVDNNMTNLENLFL